MPTLVALLACGCQTVFGDFKVGPPSGEEPAEILGTACEPGAYRCTDALLERCSDDRSGWVVEETCPDAAQCNLNSRTCRACTPGEFMCRGAALETCNTMQAWELRTPCPTPELCSVTADHMSGACATPACPNPGAHQCDGAKLMRCSPGQERLEAVALCANHELCDPAYADELAAAGERGACRPPACNPDAFSCDGQTLRHCAIDRTGWDVVTDCDSSDQCSASRGACAACAPGEVECNGVELRRCTDAGSWMTLRTCDSVGLCDQATGSCKAAECDEPGALRCGHEGIPVLEACSADYAWERAGFCATVELCSTSAGRCLTPACEENEARCRGNRHERCSADRTRWERLATCAEGEICEAVTGCGPGPCTEGAVRCNGSSLERCVLGRYQEEQRCATPILCNAETVSCTLPVCEAGSFRCNVQNLLRCLPGRNDERDFLSCGQGQICDDSPALDTGLAECDNCPADAYRCEGNDLMRCTSDGLEEVKVKSCSGSCAVTNGEPACP